MVLQMLLVTIVDKSDLLNPWSFLYVSLSLGIHRPVGVDLHSRYHFLQNNKLEIYENRRQPVIVGFTISNEHSFCVSRNFHAMF